MLCICNTFLDFQITLTGDQQQSCYHITFWPSEVISSLQETTDVKNDTASMKIKFNHSFKNTTHDANQNSVAFT